MQQVQVSPIPATPIRPLLRGDDGADVRVKDITGQFRAHGLFSFKGATKYQDCKLFLQRVSGAIRTHTNANFARVLEGPNVPREWLMVLFQVLVILTTGAAASSVYDYPDDGVRAYMNLERMIRRTTAVNAIPDLRRRINSWTSSGKDPTTAFTKFRIIQRELVALLPTYDIHHSSTC